MNWETVDWATLERLRAMFLAETAGRADYWTDERVLATYDTTFAQRIGWKWDYVLNELFRRGWTPPPGALLDWGCGSGIAHRAFLERFGSESISHLFLWDRSPLAMNFAARRVGEKHPTLAVTTGKTDAPAVLLISHVVTELELGAVQALADAATRATTVLWVEPGHYEASITLIGVRERLRPHFNLVAPCTHQDACGLLAPGNERHWCHHFAPSPPEVFTDSGWVRFARVAGIDMRSLPLSVLVLDKRPPPAFPAGATRVLGRPRLYKGHALLQGCDASGVRERRLTRRVFPDVFRSLKKGKCDPLQAWTCNGDEITQTDPL